MGQDSDSRITGLKDQVWGMRRSAWHVGSTQQLVALAFTVLASIRPSLPPHAGAFRPLAKQTTDCFCIGYVRSVFSVYDDVLAS